MSLSASSQTSDSVTCIPNISLRAALKLIEQGKRDGAELELTKENYMLSEDRVALRDSLIAVMRKSDGAFRDLVQNLRDQIANANEQLKIKDAQIASEKKKVRKERQMKRLSIIGGISAVVAVIIISL